MMRVGSLFSGAGMLDVAVQSVLGGTVAWHCENNPAAAAVLAYHYPDIPNLGDITAVAWDTVERVDVLTGGWPCQPWSLAGKQKGAADDRALWPYVARAVRMVRPRLVVLENVSAVVTAGELARATASLAAVGYVGSWACVRASDVGAPHRRERAFIVAADTRRPDPDASILGCGTTWRDDGQRDGHTAVDSDRAPADTRGSARRQAGHAVTGNGGRADGPAGSAQSGGRDRAPADTEGNGRQDRVGGGPATEGSRSARDLLAWGPYEPAIRRWEGVVGRPAPAPTEPNRNDKPRLRPHLPEWMMGWPDGWVTEVPGVSRNDQLRICGNGVVPQQAAYALELLLKVDRQQAA